MFDIDGQIEDSPIRDLFTLKLAANVQNREFIAHPNCQHQLQQTWLKESEPILFLSPIKFVLFFIFLMITIPLQVLLIWFFPKSKIGKMKRVIEISNPT